MKLYEFLEEIERLAFERPYLMDLEMNIYSTIDIKDTFGNYLNYEVDAIYDEYQRINFEILSANFNLKKVTILLKTPIEKNYISSYEYAKAMNMRTSDINLLCECGDFEGAYQVHGFWFIPRDYLHLE